MGEKNRIADVPERLRDAWLASADKALAEHRSSVAVISIASLLDPESGLMRGLQERGYAVRAPGDPEAIIEAGEGAAAHPQSP